MANLVRVFTEDYHNCGSFSTFNSVHKPKRVQYRDFLYSPVHHSSTGMDVLSPCAFPHEVNLSAICCPLVCRRSYYVVSVDPELPDRRIQRLKQWKHPGTGTLRAQSGRVVPFVARALRTAQSVFSSYHFKPERVRRGQGISLKRSYFRKNRF